MEFKSLFFGFTGRISRKIYWMSYLALLGVFGLSIVALACLPVHVPAAKIVVIVLMTILTIVYCWAGMAIQIKRWHDRDKSGWWALIALIPYLGGLWVFVECGCLPGTEGPNRFGDDPLQSSAAAPKINW